MPTEGEAVAAEGVDVSRPSVAGGVTRSAAGMREGGRGVGRDQRVDDGSPGEGLVGQTGRRWRCQGREIGKTNARFGHHACRRGTEEGGVEGS